MRWLIAALFVTGCASAPPPPPEVLVACDFDIAPLAQCRYPVDIPSDAAEALAALFVALSVCVEAAAQVEHQATRR